MQIATRLLFLIASTLCIGGEPAPILKVNHQGEAVSVVFSPDGKILAAGSGHRGIIFWDAATGKEIRRIEGAHVGDYIAFSPDGKTLASTRNWQQGKIGGTVHLWDVATGKLRKQFLGDQNMIRCVAFSADGKLLAAHSQWDPMGLGAVRVWDLATGKEFHKISTNSAGHTIAFSPDSKHLAFDVQYGVRLCQTETGKELRKLEGHQALFTKRGISSGHLNAVAFSRDGKLLATASCDNMACIWEVATGKPLQVLEGHQGFVNTVVFFPDGQTVVTGGEDGTIRCWHVATGKQLSQIQAHGSIKRQDNDPRKDVFSLSFSPDGKKLASAGRDTAVKVWDVATVLKAVQP